MVNIKNKNIVKKAVCIFMSALILFSSFATTVFADNTADNSIFISADEIKNKGSDAIQTALNKARDNASSDNVYHITVESGNYQLDKSLCLYSNTYLNIDGVNFVHTGESRHNLIRTGYYSSGADDGPEGYDAYVNITVDGGESGAVLDANNTLQNTPVKIGHASDITLKNITVMNVRNAHLVELAGINGLTFENCTLKNQLLDVEACNEVSTYEAIQLDILEYGHFKNYRAEDLTIKNAVFNNCTFQNCPRGIGSHSSVLNNPFDSIKITNCSFDNMTSCAIQTLNWKNSEISNNTIKNTPRGISVYSVIKKGKCTHLASEMAEQGNTTNHINCDEYVEPLEKHNITISNNNIVCGNISDPYMSTYTKAGITVTGNIVDNGVIPDGNYYVNGVDIVDNNISSSGTGIKLSDSRNVLVKNNTVKYIKSNDDKNYYGVHLTEDCRNVSVSSNDIQGSKTDAVFVNNSNADVINNKLSTNGSNGVYLFSSSSNSISNNTITKAENSGIKLYNNSSAEKVDSNTVTSANKYGIIETGQSEINSIKNNKLSKQTESAVEIMDSKAGDIVSNTISQTAKNGIYVHKNKYSTSVGNISDNIITLKNTDTQSCGIKIYKQVACNGISNNTITGGAFGIRISEKSTVKSVKGNNLKNNTVNSIYIADNCTVKLGNNFVFASPVLSYLSNTGSGVSINWKKVNNASEYVVFRKTKSGKWTQIATTSSLSYTDKTAKAGTVYYYTVRSKDSSGALSSISDKVLSIKRMTKPSVSTANTKDGIKIKWNKITGASGYYVYLVSGSGTVTQIAKITKPTTLSYTYKKVKNASKYIFVVCAYSGSSNSAKSKTAGVFLSTPVISSAKNNGKRQVALKWRKNAAATGYQIKYVCSSAVKTITVSNKNSVSRTIKNLTKGKTYKFYVRSYKTVSGKKYYSPYSAAKSVKIS